MKCPALAYLSLMETTLKLEAIPEWTPFRDYQVCPSISTDLDVGTFLAQKAIPQCGLCPNSRSASKHCDPLRKNRGDASFLTLDC